MPTLVKCPTSAEEEAQHTHNTRHTVSMSGLEALGLAANIFQVLSFATNLLSDGRQIYQAGSTVQNAELEMTVKDFVVLNSRLKSCARPDPEVQGPLDQKDQVRLEHQNQLGPETD